MQAASHSPLPADRAQADRQFSERIGYVKHVIGRLCWAHNVRDDDLADNALCWAWQRFAETKPPLRCLETPIGEIQSPNWILHCWRAARWGFHRALRGTQFANTRTPGYVDAMDRIGDPLSAAGCPVVDFQFAYVDQRDLLDKLPDNLRSICEALLVGFTQAEIAAMRGVSLGTVNRRVDELRVFVRALLRAR